MKLISAAMLTLLLAGCGGEEFQDLRDFVKNSGQDMRGKIPPAPEVKPYEPFVYNNAENLSDPFKPRKLDARVGGRLGPNQPDMDRPKEALEEFPLESLKMVGYLQQRNTSYALLRAPDSRIYRVKPGNYLGLNFGKIKEITGKEITVREVVQDSSGDWVERISTLQLAE